MFRQRSKMIYDDELLYFLVSKDDLVPVTYDQILRVIIYQVDGHDDFILGVLTRSGTRLRIPNVSGPECRELCNYLEDRHGFRGFESVEDLTPRYYSFRIEGFRVRDSHVEYQDDFGTWRLAAWLLPDDMARFWTVMRLPPWISRPLLALAPHVDILNWISCIWSLIVSWRPFRRKVDILPMAKARGLLLTEKK